MTFLVTGLSALILAAPVAMMLGFRHSAIEVFEMLGTLIVMMSVLGHVVFFDSKKRWPNVGAFERFSRVITFYRGR